MPLPQEFLDELKSRSDLTEVASSYVSLKRQGRNLVGLCPFHNEKTPSFNIYPENGSFYCFGCGAGGDVITFVRKIENLDYMEAIRFLAQRAGMTVPEDAADNGLMKLRTRIYEINRETARYYHQMLLSPQGKKALDYLMGRALSMKTIRHFGLGYAPPGRFSLVDFLEKKGYKEDEIVSANLAFRGRSGHLIDRFYDRAMFPIIDLRGNIMAFGGRILGPGEPKYINSSDTPVYHKGRNLFALNFAKDSGQDNLILCEGYMDVIALHQAGFTNAIAGLGTALTPEQAKLISRYTGEVIASYDADSAGQKAASRSIPLLREAGLNVRILVVPNGKDPDEFIRSYGENGHARFQQLLDQCGNDVEYQLEKARRTVNVQTPDGKVAFLESAVKILATLDNPIEQEVYAGKLSEETHVERTTLLSQIKRQRQKQQKSERKKEFRSFQQKRIGLKDSVNPEKQDKLRAAGAEEALLAYLIRYPEASLQIFQQLPSEKFSTSFNCRVYRVIMDRMKEGKSTDLTDLSSVFSPEEMGTLARILAKVADIPISRKDAQDYVKVILEEAQKQMLQKNSSEKDLLAYVEYLKEQKTRKQGD